MAPKGSTPSPRVRGLESRLLRDALAAHHAGRLEAAEQGYRRFLARHRDHAFALQNLGLLLHQRGDFEAARAALRRAVACAPEAAGCRESLGRVLKAQGDLQGASEAFRAALDLDPDFTDARYQLGTVHHDSEDFEAAAACYRQVVSQAPAHVPAWNSLGSVHLDLGEPEEAEPALRRALGHRPDYVPARLNLAVALHRTGRLDDAARMLRALVRERPGFAEAHHNLAMVYREQGAPAEAEGAARRALALRPDCAIDHFVLAEICIERGRQSVAIERYRHCVALAPTHIGAWLRLASILVGRREIEAGVDAAHRVLALEPENAVALNVLSHAYSIAGDLEMAERYCRRSLDVEPDLPLGWYMLTQLRRFGDADREAIARVESIPERRMLDDENRSTWHFALGWMHHDCKHHSNAFSHFVRANRIHRRHREFDIEEWTQRVGATIETFGPELFARTRGFGDPTRQPVFIFGMPRSGTSLVEQILASHPGVHGAGELLRMPDCTRQVHYAPGAGEGYPRAARDIDAGLVRRLAAHYLEALRRDCPQAERITDKLPGNYLHLGFIAILLPGARLIHCRRDPLDICLSNYMQHYGEGHVYTYDLTELGLVYRQYERIMRHWRAVLPLEIHEIAYEDLIMDQEGCSRSLVAFCGLDWDPSCLHFFTHERAVSTASQWQVRRPIYRSSVRRWKAYETCLGELRRALGDAAPA